MYAHNAIGHGFGCQAIRHHIYIVTNIQARVRHAVNTLDAGRLFRIPAYKAKLFRVRHPSSQIVFTSVEHQSKILFRQFLPFALSI